MRHSYIIIDDFLDNPDKVRQSILDGGIEQFCNRGSFSGRRTPPADYGYRKMIDSKLEQVLPFKFKMDDYVVKNGDGDIVTESCCYSFQLALEDDDTWVHNDHTDWSGVLYLTPNAPIDSGTILFKKDTKPDPDKDDYDTYMTDNVGNLYNRMILFRGKDLPHRSNKPGFGDSLETGRLSQHFFFNEVK